MPKLNYLVVKQGTELPDGFNNTDSNAVEGFNNELKEIVEFVKCDELPKFPNITYQKKGRPKKPRQLAIKEIFNELDA